MLGTDLTVATIGASLKSMVAQLAEQHGEPELLPAKGPFERILWENVVYLANDEEREKAFEALRRNIGLAPDKILAASTKALLGVTQLAGILPQNQVKKLRDIAHIALRQFGGDLDQILRKDFVAAKRDLKKFPGIGDPAAEKILLFCRAHPVLALDSNGLRVLLRLGFGQEQASYAASYRSAQEAAQKQLKTRCERLIQTHLLLRRHGQEICRRKQPSCKLCPLTARCAAYRACFQSEG